MRPRYIVVRNMGYDILDVDTTPATRVTSCIDAHDGVALDQAMHICRLLNDEQDIREKVNAKGEEKQ